ncbi:hypothetical protein OLD55_09310, partial [Streptococcus pneumoniae]|nr:hypothetical protein [Streptococcus pneumoniae]
LFFYNKIGSIISIVDLPTTNIIEPIFTAIYAVGIGPFYISKFYFKIGYQERLLFTVKYKRVIYRILLHQDKYFLMVKF